ncbi:MAG: HAD family hydrolase [Betaproteobacteria bacterium]
MTSTLALFDLDHTLLSGDSDVLWCEWLMTQGLLERATFEPRNAAMEAGYKAGTVSVAEICGFYVGTRAGRTLEQWHPMRQRFLVEEIAPRIPPAARDQVRHHQDAGHTVVLTTATNRVITELTAQHLDIEHLIATECEVGADGCFTGRVAGTPNMREGKVAGLQAWLTERGTCLEALDSIAYSDSMNDAPLLSAARRAVAVDPDPRLAALARDRGWKVLRWR